MQAACIKSVIRPLKKPRKMNNKPLHIAIFLLLAGLVYATYLVVKIHESALMCLELAA